ncbi:MAG: mandelate racemase/muconate lactonizing enzyme family protein [Candidatus Dormibacteraceae bacterium]
MKLTALRTIRLEEFPNLLWVELETDEAIVGLGESFRGPLAVEAYLHELAAPYLLGQDPLAIERHWHALSGYVGSRGSGAETRGRSAVDIALWDLFGKVTGQPVYQLLGGASRPAIRVYNTCAGQRYMRRSTLAPTPDNWGTGEEGDPYDDLDAFLHRPAELARSLLSEGITAMKIWPFDPYAASSRGYDIAAADLARGADPFRRIREAVGDEIEIMLEMHGRWHLPAARRIAGAVDEYRPYWYEDPVPADDLTVLARFAKSTRVPVAASETLTGRAAFKQLVDLGAAEVLMLDVGWCGGLTEARKIAALAETAQLTLAPHDCTGPVALTAATHLSLHADAAVIQEFVRAAYHGWYGTLVTALPPVREGLIAPPAGPGLGLALRPEIAARPDATVRVSKLESR